MKDYVKNLNWTYREYPCLYQEDFSWNGFEWINVDTNNNVISFIRKNSVGEKLVCIFNFSSLEQKIYGLGVDEIGTYQVVLDTNEEKFGGSGVLKHSYHSSNQSRHGKKYSIDLQLAPNEGILLKKL